MTHFYDFEYLDDGDYVLFWSEVDGEPAVHTAWLVPGTQLED